MNHFPEKKKKRKKRTKQQKEYLSTEKCKNDPDKCGRPWSYLCNRNIHNCAHLKHKWFASLSNENKKYILDNPNCYYHIKSKKLIQNINENLVK